MQRDYTISCTYIFTVSSSPFNMPPPKKKEEREEEEGMDEREPT